MPYGSARFNAWLSAVGFDSAEQMAAAKAESLAYFCTQYRLMGAGGGFCRVYAEGALA